MVESRRGSRARDRVIGARLRAIRKERTTFSMEQAAKRAQYPLTTLFRIENGQRHVSPADVATLCTIYDLPRKERQELIEEAENTDAAGCWDRPQLEVSGNMRTLASYEQGATAITDWSVSLVPGLLQTRDYAVGLMRSAFDKPTDIEPRWAARRHRQQLLGTVDYTAFVGEAALRIPFGGREALRGQLRHLITARDRGIGVRVVPEHPPHSLLIHSWYLMEFSRDRPVLYVEAWLGALYLHDEAAESYLPIRDLAAKAALSVADSQTLMRQRLQEL